MICRQCTYQDHDAKEGATCPEDGSYLVSAGTHEAHPTDVLLGQTIGNEFALVDILGIGGFGTVYRGLQMPIRRPVALKILHSQFYSNEGVRQRFFHEAKAIGSLSDPTIVKLIRYGEEPPGSPLPGCAGFFFMAQEFVPGETLREVQQRAGYFTEERAISVCLQILRALADAHRHGLVHRDLKPGNIMLVQDALGEESVKVLDFGVAKAIHDNPDEDSSTPTTMTGMMLGTPNYMAPEQIRSLPVGPWTDLYALGVLLYEMLCGRRPFNRASRTDTLKAHLLEGVPDLPPELAISSACMNVIQKALQKIPADRYQSAQEMAADLKLILGHTGSSINMRPTTDEMTLDASLSMHALDIEEDQLAEQSDKTGQSEAIGPPVSGKRNAGLYFIVALAALLLSTFLIWKSGVFGSKAAVHSVPIQSRKPIKKMKSKASVPPVESGQERSPRPTGQNARPDGQKTREPAETHSAVPASTEAQKSETLKPSISTPKRKASIPGLSLDAPGSAKEGVAPRKAKVETPSQNKDNPATQSRIPSAVQGRPAQTRKKMDRGGSTPKRTVKKPSKKRPRKLRVVPKPVTKPAPPQRETPRSATSTPKVNQPLKAQDVPEL